MATSPAAVNPFDQFDSPPQAANPFDQFDEKPKPVAAVTAPEPIPQKPKGNALTGAIDMLMTGADRALLSPLERSIASLGAKAFGQDPEKAKAWVDRNLSINPLTQTGDTATNSAAGKVAAVFSPVGQTVGAVDKGIGAVAGPTVQNIVRKVADTGSDFLNVIPGVGVAGKFIGEGMTAAKAAAESARGVARTPLETAEAAGIRILPSTVKSTTGAGTPPSVLARATESSTGHQSALEEVIKHNKVQNNGIAMQDLGLAPGTAVSDTALEQAAKPHIKTYEAVKATVPDVIAPDRTFTLDVANVGRGTDSTLPLPADIQKYQDAALTPMNGSQMLATISDLRTQGWKGWNAKDNPQLNAVGNAQLELANALEKRLGQVVEDRAPELAGAYQDARKGFAKIEAVKAARVGNDIDTNVLSRMNKKTGALDGGLKVLADLHESFPKEMRINAPSREEFSRLPNAVARWGPLGLIPGVQTMGGKLIAATRGEQKLPQLGPTGPLGYNYRGESPLPARNMPLDLTPPPGQAFTPNQGELPFNEPLPPPTPPAQGPTGQQAPLWNKPADVLPPLDSTVTRALSKAQRDHLIQVLARLRKAQ